MAGKGTSSKKGTRSKSKKKSGGFPPVLIGLIALGVVCFVGFGIFLLLPKNIRQQVSSSVPVPGLPGRGSSHEEFQRALLDAERDHARVMNSIKDKGSAQSAMPRIKSTLAKLAKAATDWVEFIEQHPVTASESNQLFLTRSRELDKIRQEFPYDLAFGSNPEILGELANAGDENKACLQAQKLLGDKLNSANRLSMPGPQFGPPNQQPSADGNPANSGLPAQPAPVTPNPEPAPTVSTTPPDQPPEDVPIPESDLLKKYGSKGVVIRLVGLPPTTRPEMVVFKLLPLFGPGQHESQSIAANGATFMVAGPIDDFDKLVQSVGPVGKVLKSDKSRGLIVLWVSPDKATPPNLPPGVPPGFPPGRPRT